MRSAAPVPRRSRWLAERACWYRGLLAFRGTTPPAPGADPNLQYASSPLTLLIFGVLAGYYVSYAIGLLRWKASVKRAGT